MDKTEGISRILVVDEEERHIEFMKSFLQYMGFQAEGVLGGEEALEEIRKNPPDLLITEIMTSGISGFEITKRLRAEKATRTLPIIIMTAQRSKSDRMQAIESGADEFITKPVDKEQVAKRIISLLELNYYRSLVDEKKKLDTIVDGMSDGIIIMDAEMKVLRYNNAARQLIGLKRSLPRNFDLLDHLYSKFKVSIQKNKLTASKKRIEQLRILRPETEKAKALYLSGKINRLIDPLGSISSMVLILRDVTESVREELQKEAFLSSISHKLRTPATVLTGMLRILKEDLYGNLSDNQRNFLLKIKDSADTISQLIEKLIAFNTLTRKELMMEGKFINLASFLKNIEKRIKQNYSHNRKIDIFIDNFSTLPDCYFNNLQLEMIFWHLIDNAIKFNDKEVPQIKINGNLNKKQKIEITISDNGPGIPPENHELIFTQFYQYEKVYTGNVEGLGLGLSMVRKILEDWNQKISLDSDIGKGTTFEFTLPIEEIS